MASGYVFLWQLSLLFHALTEGTQTSTVDFMFVSEQKPDAAAIHPKINTILKSDSNFRKIKYFPSFYGYPLNRDHCKLE